MEKDKRIGETHGELTIIARSIAEPNGYLYFYWCRCSCGNVKRYRYDRARKAERCGMCEDFSGSGVNEALKEYRHG